MKTTHKPVEPATPLIQTGHIHIDRIDVTGPLDHVPLGDLFYKDGPHIDEVVPAGSSAITPKMKRNPKPDDIYIKSMKVQDNGRADCLTFNCCPPQILQGHNFFGHSDLLDYTYAMFDQQTKKYGVEVDPEQRNEWRTGQVKLTQIHLTGNFWLPPGQQLSIIDAIDQANRSGKHRDIKTCISLGFTDKRRSVHHGITVYDKSTHLDAVWPKPGPLQAQIKEDAGQSIRIEVKLFHQGLCQRELQYVNRWKDVDIDALFFEVLEKYNIVHAIQRQPAQEVLGSLSKGARKAYLLWRAGSDIEGEFSRTTCWKYRKEIMEKAGVDIKGGKPEAEPAIDLRQILTPENLVPLPDWAEGHARYWAPGTAFLDDEVYSD